MSNPDDLDDGLAYDFDAEHEVIFDAKDGSPPTKKVQKRSIEQDDDDVDDIDGKKEERNSEDDSNRPISKRQKKLQKCAAC